MLTGTNICLFSLRLAPLLYVMATSQQASPTLVKVLLAFRHGARSPSYGTYQNNLYKKDDKQLWPNGAGQLTSFGKRESFELGQKLKERYGTFIGDYYVPKEFKAYATIKERTIMSAQLVLAALFPPKGYQRWSAIDWQPIPVFPDYIINRTDDLNCPWLLVSSMAEMKNTSSSDYNFDERDISLLSQHVGQFETEPFTFMSRLWDVWDAIYCQNKESLPLPEWIKNVYPDKIPSAILKYVKFYLAGTPLRRKIVAGPYGKALADFFTNSLHKMEIHSWHDMNIIALTSLLGIDIEEYPHTASCVSIELHNRNEEKYIEVYFYSNSKVSKPILKKMPCGYSCSFNDSIILFKSYGEEDFTDLCFSKKNVYAFNKYFETIY